MDCAEYLNELGARARMLGQNLMVHNHNWEFQRVFGDRTVFDMLMAHVKDMAAGPFPGRIEIVGEGIIDFPVFAASQGPVRYVVEARPALRRSDLRPVRSCREGLQLPRLRDVLSPPEQEDLDLDALLPPAVRGNQARPDWLTVGRWDEAVRSGSCMLY